MNRNGKALFSVLTIAMALSAMVASAAQAAPEFTAEKFPATVIGSQVGSFALTDEGSITCEEGSYSGELTESSSTLRLEPEYGKCKSQGWPVTFFMNGCGYLLHLKEKTNVNNYKGNFDFACPAGKVLEAKAYENPTHTIVLCRLTIAPQSGLLSVSYTNFVEGGQEEVEMVPKVEKIVYTQEGTFCVNGKFGNGVLEGTVNLEAEDEAAEPDNFKIFKE